MGVKQYVEEMLFEATLHQATSSVCSLLWGEEEMPQSLQKAIREERKVTKREKLVKEKEIQ